MLDRQPGMLVISHDASMSGAPILLLNLCRLLIKHRKVNIHFVVSRDGLLTNEFLKVAPTTVLKAADYGREATLLRKVANFTIHKIRLLNLISHTRSFDLIFGNTIINGKLLQQLGIWRKPQVVYVHELESVIELYLRQKDAVYSLTNTDVFAYPSSKVKDLLLHKYKIAPHKLLPLSYYFDVNKGDIDPAIKLKKRNSFRSKYALGESDFVVGNMGTISERKGTDIFIEVCKQVIQSNPKIKFCWVGNFRDLAHELKVKESIADARLSDNIVFTGPLPNDLYNSAAFDILFLSSREDPYPLVVLEAALMHVPSMCFSDSGGITDFVGADAGWLIDEFSIDDAADKILALALAQNEVRLKSEVAFNKAIALHCNPGIIIQQFDALMNNVMPKSGYTLNA
jgi:glycosyltransferase involved in cell wall biosynthesis